MSLKRTIIHMLDNPVGRPLLGRLATLKVRQLLHSDVEIGFEQGWYHRIGPYIVPDRPRFDYYEPTVLAWSHEIPTYFRDAEDFWFSNYQPRSGDVIIDIGAGRGEDSLPFSRKTGPTGVVIAVEAQPGTFRQLERFCRLNQLHNVITLHAAVMDAPGTIQITDGELWETNSVQTDGSGITIRATTVDDICREQQIDHIDFLKMNIEGAEAFALRGMAETIEKIAKICVCCHDFRAERGDGEQYRTRNFVTDFLKRNGFVVSSRSSDRRDYVRDHIFGTRRPGPEVLSNFRGS
jgi:FkbM family methyltransferase